MLHVTDLSFRHGERVLFDRASTAISDGWKVGLVGRNGAGKSTLLKLIQGELEAATASAADALSNQRIPKSVEKHIRSYYDQLNNGK